jgi:glycosyltransferase involved in cell wall biosynthesis
MKICGDWIFYLHVARGGKIAYCAETHNYYRFHTSNTSARTYTKPAYYREHEAVAEEIARLYRVPAQTLTDHRRFIERFFEDNGLELAQGGTRFSDLYGTRALAELERRRVRNVLIVTFGFCTGGGEVFPIRLANGLKQAGLGVTVFNFRGEPDNDAVRAMLAPDIPVVERNSRFGGVDALVAEFGVDLVHTHHASADSYFGAARPGLPDAVAHVVTMHGMYEMMEPGVFEATTRRIWEAVDRWVYISDKNLTPFKAAGLFDPQKFIKIPNGMSRHGFEQAGRRQLQIPKDAFVLCLASRAIPEKGWHEAIEITREARVLSGADIHLLLLGDGPVHDELQARPMPPFVHLLGFVKDAIRYYAASDLGLLPTTFKGESFPLSIIECLMAGRPVIASDVGEIRDMLQHPQGGIAGFLIDIAEGAIPIHDTAEQVARIVTDHALYETKRKLATEISARFELGTVIEHYRRVYADAAAARTG